MMQQEPDGRRAEIMYSAFYYRYRPYLCTVVGNALGFLHDANGVDEVVNDALLGFYHKRGRFYVEAAADDVKYDQRLRSYLGRLARWRAGHARDFQKSFGADAVDLAELDRLTSRQARLQRDEEPPAEDPRVLRVERWLLTLREVERDVLSTYFFDDHRGRKSSRLPSGVAFRLAAKHGVTTSNIRHLKLKLQAELRAQFRSA